MNLKHMTDFLTSRNSFITGVGSVLNIGGNYFNYTVSSSPEEADKKAIGMDWRLIGIDMLDSMKSVIYSSDKADNQKMGKKWQQKKPSILMTQN